MKKILVALIAVLMLACLGGCGAQAENSGSTKAPSASIELRDFPLVDISSLSEPTFAFSPTSQGEALVPFKCCISDAQTKSVRVEGSNNVYLSEDEGTLVGVTTRLAGGNFGKELVLSEDNSSGFSVFIPSEEGLDFESSPRNDEKAVGQAINEMIGTTIVLEADSGEKRYLLVGERQR